MKVIIIACLEPEHLATCLRALLLWVATDDIIVVNNGTTPENTHRINEITSHYSIQILRPHELCHGENSIIYINESLKAVCRKHPEEIVLKIDEDIILCSNVERFQFEHGVFFVPNLTINNFTTKNYLRAFWPDLYEALKSHAWMWHNPHPKTGGDFRLELTKRFYTLNPVWLIRYCEENQTIEYVDGSEWFSKSMMGDRGISSTAMAFHGSDYLSLVQNQGGVEEILIAEGVRSGRFRYKVDYGLFCHHINYWPIRQIVKSNSHLVNAFNERIIDYYESQRK